MADESQPLHVHCPICGKLTDRIEGVEVPLFVCLVVYYVFNTMKIIGCPRCVRNRLIGWGLASIPLANMFAILIFPVYLVVIVSRSIGTKKPDIPDEYLYLTRYGAPLPSPKGSLRAILLRTFLVVLFLALVLTGVFFVLPAVFNP